MESFLTTNNILVIQPKEEKKLETMPFKGKLWRKLNKDDKKTDAGDEKEIRKKEEDKESIRNNFELVLLFHKNITKLVSFGLIWAKKASKC